MNIPDKLKEPEFGYGYTIVTGFIGTPKADERNMKEFKLPKWLTELIQKERQNEFVRGINEAQHSMRQTLGIYK